MTVDSGSAQMSEPSRCRALDVLGLGVSLNPRSCSERSWGRVAVLSLLFLLPAPGALSEDKGPSLAATVVLTGVPIGLNYSTTKYGLEHGGTEAGPLARHMNPEGTALLALGLEVTTVQLVGRKNKRLAWGLLAGFAAGHLFIAGCEKARCF